MVWLVNNCHEGYIVYRHIYTCYIYIYILEIQSPSENGTGDWIPRDIYSLLEVSCFLQPSRDELQHHLSDSAQLQRKHGDSSRFRAKEHGFLLGLGRLSRALVEELRSEVEFFYWGGVFFCNEKSSFVFSWLGKVCMDMDIYIYIHNLMYFSMIFGRALNKKRDANM